MAFLQPLTAIKTPHPAPVAPLAGHRWPRGVMTSGLVLSSGKGSVLPLEDATKSLVRSQVVLSDNTYAGHSSLLRSFEKSNFSRCQRKASPYF